jgi:hypothetical protein
VEGIEYGRPLIEAGSQRTLQVTPLQKTVEVGGSSLINGACSHTFVGLRRLMALHERGPRPDGMVTLEDEIRACSTNKRPNMRIAMMPEAAVRSRGGGDGHDWD